MLKRIPLAALACLAITSQLAFAQQAERSKADPRYSAAVYIGGKATLVARVEKDCLPLLGRNAADQAKFFDTWKVRNQRFLTAGRKFLDFRAKSAGTADERQEMTTTYVMSVSTLANSAVEGTLKVYGDEEGCRRLEKAINNKSLDIDGGEHGAPREVGQLLAWADEAPAPKGK